MLQKFQKITGTRSQQGLLRALLRISGPLLSFVLLAAIGFSRPPWSFLAVTTDHNGFALNPAWQWQYDAALAFQKDGKIFPDKAELDALFNEFTWPQQLASGDWPKNNDFGSVSDNHPTQDFYSGGSPIFGHCACWRTSDEGKIQSGHVNFMEATYYGTFSSGPDHQAAVSHDDDVDNFNLETQNTFIRNFGPNNGAFMPGGAGATGPAPGQPIQLEFKYGETLHYYNGPTDVGGPYGNYWAKLGDVIDSNPTQASNMTFNHEAAVIGLFGLDMVHAPAGPELHPVHALLIRENNTNPSIPQQDDFWAYFARVSGNEGDCSSLYHTLPLRNLTIEIPPPPNYRDLARIPLPGVRATLAAATVFFVTQQGEKVQLIDPSLSSGPAGTFLTLHLPVLHLPVNLDTTDYIPNAVYGEIHLTWTPPPRPITNPAPIKLPTPVTNPAPLKLPDTMAISPERTELELRSWKLIPAAQQAVAKNLYAKLKPPAVAVDVKRGSMLVTDKPPADPPKTVPELIVTRNQRDEKERVAGFQASCIATNGKVPLYEGVCTQFQPVTTLSPIGANGAPLAKASDGWYPSQLSVVPKAESHSGYPIKETVLTFSPSGKTVTVPAGSKTPVPIPEGVTQVTYRSLDTLGHEEAARTETFKVGKH